MASIILPPGSAPANPSEGEIYYDNTAKQVKFRDNAGFKGLGGADLQGEPHIITKKLFPAYLGKLLDDTTSHSGDYGTEQADGRMYYYTEIAGSKPIHDPRIGAHFGSQRHKIKSLQLLEQETATHGKNVFSVDGREWIRAIEENDDLKINNNAHGNYLSVKDEDYLEIVGYFNDANFSTYTFSGNQFEYKIDGGSFTSGTYGNTTVTTPILDRYLDAGGIVNLGISVSLGIHTLRLKYNTSGSGKIYAIELIAQDTTSSSTKVQIQVPAQDVVSYGRKFSVSATAQHYDPFNGFSSGDASALATKVDTATSLGLAKWLHSGTYYRPYNGMRVVKWIDDNGAIKTSVTCMPPNAKSIGDSSTVDSGNSAANAKANASASNDTFYPTFEAHTTDVNEDNLHEVAKTFHWREFGNGAANGGTGATWADASMLSNTDDIAYCMDDGLTSVSADDYYNHSTYGLLRNGAGDKVYFTFIGTGISWNTTLGIKHWAQNLPYGTHVIEFACDSSNQDAGTFKIDGVAVKSDFTSSGDLHIYKWHPLNDITFHQPKKPLIPDSACVLADYMVFADFKPQTTAGQALISTGVRRQNISRDVFFDETDGDSFTFAMNPTNSEGFYVHLSGNADSDTSMKMRIPSFGTNYVQRGYQSDSRSKLFIGDTDNDSNATKDNTATYGSYAHLTSDLTLGVYNFGSNAASGQNGNMSGFDIVTPIHTSHHYQTFKTSFLHELIGGDRSMEQTNLICSSDGKSWDEVTRDTSYMGKIVVQCREDTGGWFSNDAFWKFDIFRGMYYHTPMVMKDSWCFGYDRWICLKSGYYRIDVQVLMHPNTGQCYIYINGNTNPSLTFHQNTSSTTQNYASGDFYFNRGDYVQGYDQIHGQVWSLFRISKI